MYNNRRNNRFSIFIAAIIVSLLVLLTGCASTKKETDLAMFAFCDSADDFVRYNGKKDNRYMKNKND